MPDYWKNLARVDPAALLRQVRREQAERNLPEFIRQAWPVIEPGTTFIDNWHIDCIGEYLEAVNRGQITRLIVNMPPRHMKSLEITVCYPAWTWVKHPERRFIKVSYSDSLSRKHNVLTRDIIQSPWYTANWGDRFSLKDDVNRQNEFKNTHQGLMFSTSVGGALTGEGGDCIILDDPQNPLQANSETEREATIAFFKNTLQSRLNDPKTGVFIIVMQRLHEKDLTGQYEQTPAPADGLIFKREWLQNFFDPKAAPHQSMLIQSWDMAFTKSEGSAKVAGYIVGRSGADIYIWDLVNEKMTFTESVAAVRTLTGKWPKARAKVIENKANGPAIVDLLKKQIPGMVEFNPKGSKQERALSVTPYFEAGNIHFPKPETAPWVHDTIQDLLMFPKGEYKDDIDALVQAILYLMDKPAKSPPKAEALLSKDSYWRR